MNDVTKRPSMGSPSLAMPVETQLGSEHGGTVEVGTFDAQNHTDEAGLTVDIGNDSTSVRRDDDSNETTLDRQEAPAEGAPEPLPDFDPTKPEVAEAYNARFTTEGGGYNMANLSADFYANGGEGLSEGTYKWLESRGIDRATAKQIEEGQKALAGSGVNELFTRAGGEDAYRGAIAWATEGNGYTPEQRKAFNAALDVGGEHAAMAVDALMARAKKANPGGFRAARRQSPARTTGNAGGGAAPAAPAVKPYASYADYQADLRKAKAENNQALFDEVRRRGKASKFY